MIQSNCSAGNHILNLRLIWMHNWSLVRCQAPFDGLLDQCKTTLKHVFSKLLCSLNSRAAKHSQSTSLLQWDVGVLQQRPYLRCLSRLLSYLVRIKRASYQDTPMGWTYQMKSLSVHQSKSWGELALKWQSCKILVRCRNQLLTRQPKWHCFLSEGAGMCICMARQRKVQSS